MSPPMMALASVGAPAGAGAGTLVLPGTPIQILVLLTLLTVLPAAVISVTPFLRITLVLHFLRQALGTQTAPSNQVLLGLSLFLTILVVQPVGLEIYTKAWQPYQDGLMSGGTAFEEGSKPLKAHLIRFVREKDVKLFVEFTRITPPRSASDLSLTILVPAYILSELRAGFQIGAVLFLPFLVVDLIVASVTLSVGMVQLPPVMISAPLKVLVFVLADGWNLVIGSLMKSFVS